MNHVKELGSAHHGMSDWYFQRVSAVLLVLLLPLPFLLLVAVYSGSIDQQALLYLLDHVVVRVLHSLLAMVLLLHAFLGVKMMLEDYVHIIGWRISLVTGALVLLASFAIWWLSMIWAWGG